jgi:general secretion pathway protein L
MNYLIIQLAADEVISAIFEKKGKSLTFIDGFRHPFDRELMTFSDVLTEIVKVGRPEAKTILSIQPALLSMREVEFPITDLRKVRDILPIELKGETAVDTEELVFEALALDGGKVLAVWCRQEELAAAIEAMRGKGVEPEAVSASVCHWSYLLPPEDHAGVVALTDGDALAIFRDGHPCFFRALGQGDFLTEITRTLAALAMSRDLTVGKLYLHGPAARREDLSLQEALPSGIYCSLLPVAGELAAAFPPDPAAARDLAGAYALARASVAGEAVNFRRGPLAYTAGRQKIRREFRITMVLAAALVVLLFAEAGLRYYFVHRDLASLDKAVQSIFREIFPTRKKIVDAVAEVRSEIKKLSGPGSDTPVLPILNRIAELKGDDITGIYEAEIEGGQVRLKGYARSIQAVNDFRGRALGTFATAEVGEVKSRPDGSVSFVFRATVKGGEK